MSVRKLLIVGALGVIAAVHGGVGAQASSVVAAACVPSPAHHGAPPAWTGSAPRIPYSLASGDAAAAFLFARPLRAGNATNPANKVLWIVRFPRDGSPLAITARSGGRTVHTNWPPDSSPGQIYPSHVNLPTAGCWVLTLAWHGHHATINLQVHRRAAS